MTNTDAQATAYRQICELLGYTDGAYGRPGVHIAKPETVLRAIREMRDELAEFRSDYQSRCEEDGV